MPLTLSGTSGVLDNSGAFVRGTAVASTSGTSIDFTGIPSWVKRITVMFSGVSTNGGSTYLIQIGTGGTPTTSGYTSNSNFGGAQTSSTNGFIIFINNASYITSGTVTITNLTSNTWTCSGVVGVASTTTVSTGGAVSLGGVLNIVRITTTNGTDTFDAGSINILYE
jgi:hypothetical protein